MSKDQKMIISINESHAREKILGGVRADGRKLDEYRNIELTPHFINESAEGSCLVKIGKTKVLVGTKVSTGTPFGDSPGDGVLMVGAELVPIASREFEAGPPGEDCIELARVVDRGIRESKMIDTKSLCITHGEKVYMVFVDIHVLDDDGNLFDAAALGAIAALKNTILPTYDPKTDSITIDSKSRKLNLNDEAISATVRKIGDKIFFDPTAVEEAATEARLTVSFKKDGDICAMQKGGEAGLTIDEITKMVSEAKKVTLKLRKLVEKIK